MGRKADIQALCNFLLEYTIILYKSGASTERTVRNVSRICKSFGYELDIAIFQRNITMTVYDPEDHSIRRTYVKRQLSPHLSFTIVNDLSALSWKAHDTDMSLEDVEKEYYEIVGKAHGNDKLVLFLASIANASFCRLFEGDWYSVLIVFLATLIAFSLRLMLLKYKLDLRAMIILVSFVSSILAWFFSQHIPTNTPDIAISTSVLFLIPGVHIINSVVDIIDGHILVGLSRGVNTMIFIMCIATGLYITFYITNRVLL